MKTIDIKNFILTGSFGEIKLGMNKKQVKENLGNPEHFGPSRNKGKLTLENAVIWRYGTVEFYFTKSKTLGMIFCDYLDNIHGGEMFSVDPWFFPLKRHITSQEIAQKLMEKKVTFRQEIKIHGDIKPFYQNIFTFSSGVQLASEDYNTKKKAENAPINAFYIKT